MEPLDFTKRLVDFNRLMDGENRESYDADDITLWRAVYADMIEFKERLLSQTREHIRKVPETDKELGGIDIPFLEAEMQSLKRGLEFWESRRPKPSPWPCPREEDQLAQWVSAIRTGPEIRMAQRWAVRSSATLLATLRPDHRLSAMRLPIRYKIILPFAVLLVFVGVVGSGVATARLTDAAGAEVDAKLLQKSLLANQSLMQIESARLPDLPLAHDTVGVPESLAAGDIGGLARLLVPIAANPTTANLQP